MGRNSEDTLTPVGCGFRFPLTPPDPRLTWFSFENSAGAGHSSRRSRPDTTTEPSFTMTDPSTMTVAQLKEELKARGLDATGLKAALLARLQAALESAGDDAGDDAKSGASRTLPATRSSLETRPSGASSGRAGRWRRLRRARGPRSSTAAPESPARATRQSRKLKSRHPLFAALIVPGSTIDVSARVAPRLSRGRREPRRERDAP